MTPTPSFFYTTIYHKTLLVSLASNYGFNSKELNEFRDKIGENKNLIKEEKWNEHFNI
ncbi:MAG: hypothetical protein MRK02_04700 [Candidatus Scalindua sp.]|nr:hypothetical protein [Candidatus Scalindua sp.]